MVHVLKPLCRLALAIALLLALAAAAPSRIHPSVHRKLRQQGSVNLIVTMVNGTSDALTSVQDTADAATATNATARGAHIKTLVNSLRSAANESQSDVTTLLDNTLSTGSASSSAVTVGDGSSSALFSTAKSYWITNQVVIKDATIDLVDKLNELSCIYEVREEYVIPLSTVKEEVYPMRSLADEASTSSYFNLSTATANATWGVKKVNAPSVWAQGVTGEGIVVANIDSGVLYTHEALKDNFRGDYGWFDANSNSSTPIDANGHGTHVMGSMAGTNGIGVAPGATWMACKGCDSEDCSESDLLECAQFILCPTDVYGNNKDCSKAPRIVNCSWGDNQGDSWFQAAVDAWVAAGIIPVFALGNSGPACTTANSPGDYENVIGVGSTTSADKLATTSSKGPAVTGTMKPDISAPGYAVKSAWYTGNAVYKSLSGTSMASPHVAGVIALLLSQQPSLNFTEVKSLIYATANTTLTASGYSCGNTTDGTFPNNMFGYGRIDALSAYQAEL